MTARTFWGNFFMVIGGLMAVLAGGCAIIYEIAAFSTRRTIGENYLGDPVLPLIIGGVPALIGFCMFMLGRWIKKRPSQPDKEVL